MTYFDINEGTKTTEDEIVQKMKDKKKPQIVSSIIQKCMLVVFVSMVFLTISFMTYLGMFVFLQNQTTTVENVTVSSEGPIRQVMKNNTMIYNDM